jgi:hypothetical protein
MDQTAVSGEWDSYPFAEWATNLLAEIDAQHRGLAKHPSEIVDRPVKVGTALEVSRRAFGALIDAALRMAPNIRVHYVVELGTEDEAAAQEARILDDISLAWLQKVVTDELDLAVGVSTEDATFGDAELRMRTLTQAVLVVNEGELEAYIRELRDPGDPVWTVAVEIRWRRRIV